MEPRILSTEIVDRDRGFTIFGPEELYNKATRKGYMPNHGDLVKNEAISGFDYISNVNYVEYTWDTTEYNPVPVVGDPEGLSGVHPLKSDSLVVYVDSTQHPAAMRFHDLITFNGPDIDSIRIFRGSDYTDSGEILSGYVRNGQISETTIPMKVISKEGVDTVTKMPLAGVCLADVEHGERCVGVVYDDANAIARVMHLHIFKTNLVMASETPARQITDIRLSSPFLTDPSSDVLTLPVNIPIDDIPLTAEIFYTDGKKTMPIDGSRVKLDGLRNAGAHDTYYIASNAGQELPLIFSYRLAKGESYVGSNVLNGEIYREYTATTESVDGAYSLKLFVVPVWVSPSKGYRLHYYLYNMTRGNVYDATAAVTHVSGSNPFDPLLMNVKQRLNVHVDVSKVNPTYRPHIHAQSFHITLLSAGTANEANFMIDYVHDGESYGEQARAEFTYDNVSHSTINIKCGYATKAEWLKGLYYDSYPLYDRRNEDNAPEPTHFELIVGGKTYLHPVDSWLQDLVVDFRVDDTASVVLRWIRRTPTITQQLGLSPMLAHQV